MMTRTLLAGYLLLGIAAPAAAQNTGGVFGPVVDANDRSVEARIAWDPGADRFVERVHYQQALSGDVRLRGIVQVRHGDGRNGLEFDNFQAQLLWQVTPDKQKWQTALRFDTLIRGQGRSAQLRIGWSNEFDLGGGTRLRATAIAGRELGEDRQRGISLTSATGLSFRLAKDVRLEAQHFGVYGTTADILPLSEQTHQLGPALTFKLSKDWSAGSRVLFGLNSASPDTQLFFSIGRGF